MNISENNKRLLSAALALIGFLIPLALYWMTYGQAAAITPPEAKKLLSMKNSDAVLIDVRTRQEFDNAHIDGSQHLAKEEILEIQTEDQLNKLFVNKKILLICNVGMSSTTTAKHLSSIGIDNVMSVRGGMQEWIGSATGPEGDIFDRYKTASGQTRYFETRVSPLHEKLSAVISGFGIKPTYTLLALILAFLLRSNKAPDLAALRWSMIFFFIGENCCAANYLLFNEKSYLFEYMHSYGMLLSFGFAAYAIIEGFDNRILKLSEPDKKCAALSLCKKCIKYEDVGCGLKRTFFMIIPATILIAIMPLCSQLHSTSYNTMIYGTFYNYSHRFIYQLFELYYCPIIAMILLSISFCILTFKKNNPLPPAKIFFAAGIGPLGFGLFRSILTGMFSENLVWFNFWEELTELIFIVGLCFILWTFRQSLFNRQSADKP